MRERPILFSAPMVKALLAGTKTQTRRIIKPQPTRTLPNTKTVGELDIVHAQGWRWQKSKNWSTYAADTAGPDAFAKALGDFSPFGVTGDRLWVRETWSQSATSVYPCPACWYRADFAAFDDPAVGYQMHIKGCGGNQADCFPCVAQREGKFKWRPSIYMQRHLSRITLEVTEVRVQRLQDISEEDAKAEGVTTEAQQGLLNGKPATLYPMTHKQAFVWLWDAINGKRAPWSTNPWLWVVSFRRIDAV